MCSWKSKPKIANKGSDPDANVFGLDSLVYFFFAFCLVFLLLLWLV